MQGRIADAALLGRIGRLAGLIGAADRLALVLAGGGAGVPRLVGCVGEALEASGVAAERLELALPEAAFEDVDEPGLLALAALRDRGVALALDGFGAGPASLTTLRRLPLTAVKLSRLLLQGLPGDPEDMAVVRAMIGMAHALGLAVIADGIETEAQRRFLADCGCDEGQGALFGTLSVDENAAN